jgi:hypothetical protein
MPKQYCTNMLNCCTSLNSENRSLKNEQLQIDSVNHVKGLYFKCTMLHGLMDDDNKVTVPLTPDSYMGVDRPL